MGSVDRHSQDAEWVRGPECGGAEGVGEGLASSPKPPVRAERIMGELILLELQQ